MRPGLPILGPGWIRRVVSTRFDDLDAAAFEEMINDLLACEVRGHGHFTPNATPIGVTDGGNDAFYQGPWPLTGGDGRPGPIKRWKVSAKIVKDDKALQKTLAKDLSEYPYQSWLIVTNVNPQDSHGRDTRAKRLNWLEEMAPGSAVIFGSELDHLLLKHPYVARTWKLGGNLCFNTGGRWAGVLPLPTDPIDALDQVIQHLAAGRMAVDVVGSIGMGQDDLARDLLLRLRSTPVEGALSTAVPLFVEADSEGAVELAMNDQVREGERPYIFVIPPGRAGSAIARLLRQERFANNASVAFVDADAHCALRLPVSRGYLASVKVGLGPVGEDRLHEWARRVLCEHRRDLALPLFLALPAFLAGRPGLVEAVIREGAKGLDGAFFDWSSAALDRADQELALRILLCVPSRRSADLPFDQLDKMVPKAAHAAHQLAGQLGAPPVDALVFEHHRFSMVNPAAARSIARLCHQALDAAAVARLHADLARLDPALRLTACERAAVWLGDEVPAEQLLAELRIEVETLTGFELSSGVQHATTLAALGPKCAAEGRALAAQVIRRYLATPAVADPRAEGAPWVSPASRLALAARLLDLHAAAASAPTHIDGVLRAALRLASAAPGVQPLTLEALGKRLADPWGDAQLKAGLLDALDAAQAALPPEHEEAFAHLLKGVAGVLLAAGVPWSHSSEMSVSFGALEWNEANPAVQPRRDRLVELAARLIRSGHHRQARAGWATLGVLWEQPPAGLRVGANLPAGVVGLFERALAVAEEALSADGAWEEWAEAENIVVRLNWLGVLCTARRAAAVRKLRTEPLYLMWRLWSDRHNLAIDPEAVANAIEGEGSWRAISDALMSAHGLTKGEVDILTCSLADMHLDADAFLVWARRVAAGREIPGTWGAPDAMTEWIEKDNALFREVLFGARWRHVPTSLHTQILQAAVPRFRLELTAMFGDRLSVSGPDRGAAGALADLLAEPSRAEGASVQQLLPVLFELILPADRAALLLGVAANTDALAQQALAQQLYMWVRYEDPAINASDLDAIVRRLSDNAGLTTLLGKIGTYRSNNDPVARLLDPELGDAVLAAIPSRLPDVASAVIHLVVAASMARSLEPWLAAVQRSGELPEFSWAAADALVPRDLSFQIAQYAVAGLTTLPRPEAGFATNVAERLNRHLGGVLLPQLAKARAVDE